MSSLPDYDLSTSIHVQSLELFYFMKKVRFDLCDLWGNNKKLYITLSVLVESL